MDTSRSRTPRETGDPGEVEMDDAEIDDNLEETFPASDPPSWTLGTDHRGSRQREADPPDHEEER